MHNGLYISEKTTKPLSTTLAWTSAIFILPGYTYLPPGMDLALVLGSNHVLVSDTHTYRFTIQTDSCNNIIKRACRYIPIWYHRTRCGFQHDVSTSQHACTHSDLPNPTQTTKPSPCLVTPKSKFWHYTKRRFPVTSNLRYMHGVLNIDKIKN